MSILYVQHASMSFCNFKLQSIFLSTPQHNHPLAVLVKYLFWITIQQQCQHHWTARTAACYSNNSGLALNCCTDHYKQTTSCHKKQKNKLALYFNWPQHPWSAIWINSSESPKSKKRFHFKLTRFQIRNLTSTSGHKSTGIRTVQDTNMKTCRETDLKFNTAFAYKQIISQRHVKNSANLKQVWKQMSLTMNWGLDFSVLTCKEQAKSRLLCEITLQRRLWICRQT